MHAVDVRAAVLTALAKLAARSGGGSGGGDAGTLSRVVGVEGSFARSADVEVQTRACEYGALLSPSSPASEGSLAAAVLERLPPLDEAAHDAALDVEPVTEEEAAAALAASVGAGSGAAAATADSLLGDLMSLEVPAPSSTSSFSATAAASGASSSQPAADALADIFGSVDLLSATTTTAAAPTTTAAAAAAPSPPSKTTPLSEDLFAAPSPPVAPSPAPAAAADAAAPEVVLHSTTALRDAASGLELTLAFSKPNAAASPGDTVVVATATRAPGAEGGALTNFGLQAAVPKYAKLRLDPATGTSLEAGGAGGGGGSPGKDAAVITQRLHLTNTAHGSKPLALRLLVSWTTPGGEPRLEMIEVKDLPATL